MGSSAESISLSIENPTPCDINTSYLKRLFDIVISDKEDGDEQSAVEHVTNRTKVASYNENHANIVDSNRHNFSHINDVTASNPRNILTIGIACSEEIFDQRVDHTSPAAVYFLFDVGHKVFPEGFI